MDQQLSAIFTSVSSLLLLGGITAALFFASVGIREIKSQFLEGLLYLGLAAFFLVIHLYYLSNIPVGSPWAASVENINLWTWVTSMVVPALITVLLLRGLFDLLRGQRQSGLYRLFFGLTLLCFVYMIGSTWASDSKACVAAFYGLTWIDLEKTFHY